ncbi:MAG: hypothetical protein IT434_02220 [Phycisphaerales bacterium]|jgi:DNA polymerase-4|nr:hypothetical protein [Phycisphaerales bacterium]
MLRILYVDMNSFFASCEQQLRPELRGKPIAVVPLMADTTSVIAASYPAKKFGVKTGTKVGDAKRMCPDLILVKGSHDEYIRFHHRVIAAIDTVVPVDKIHSIDEVSCRLVPAERPPEAARALALRVKRAITTRVGECLTSSVGIAPNRFVAKVAADMQKPDGLTIIEAHELPQRLFSLNLIDLPGIGSKMLVRLNRAGINTVEDLCTRSEKELRAAWQSVVGVGWFHRLQGKQLIERGTSRRTIGHSHVLGPERRERHAARAVAVRLLTKLAQRARHLGYVADELAISVAFLMPRSVARSESRWHSYTKLQGINDTPGLMRSLRELWDAMPERRAPILKLGLTLSGLTPIASATASLFESAVAETRLSKAIDAINKKLGPKLGADAVYPASMHEAKRSAPRRIAFGNIPDLDVPDVSNE